MTKVDYTAFASSANSPCLPYAPHFLLCITIYAVPNVLRDTSRAYVAFPNCKCRNMQVEDEAFKIILNNVAFVCRVLQH